MLISVTATDMYDGRFCLKRLQTNITFHLLACAFMSCTGYVNVILNRRLNHMDNWDSLSDIDEY